MKNIFRHHHFYGVVISVLFFMAGVLVLDDYGITWDEKESFLAGYANLEVVRSLISGEPISWPWHELRGYYFVLDTLRGAFARLLCGRWHFLELAEAYHLFHLVLSAAALFVLYLLVTAVGGSRRAAFFASLTLALFPRFIAHAQNNPKDLPALFVFVITVYALVRVLRRGGLISSAVAGGLLALALTTTPLSVFIPVIFFAWLLIGERGILLQRKKEFLAVFLFAGICFYLFWPWLWDDPLAKLAASVKMVVSFRVPFQTLYLGEVFTGEQMPWHYFIVMFLVVTPVLYTVFALLSPAAFLKTGLDKTGGLRSLVILGWVWAAVLVAVEMQVGSHYDGIRHFLPVVPAFCLLAGTGIEMLFRFCEKASSRETGRVLVLGLSGVVAAGYLQVFFDVAKIHPYQSAYLNRVTNLFLDNNAEDYFETEYWGQTYREGALWLNRHMEKNAEVCVPKNAVFAVDYYLEKEVQSEFTAQFFIDTAVPKYLMLIPRKAVYNDFMHWVDNTYEPVYTIRRQQGTLLKIFKNTLKKK